MNLRHLDEVEPEEPAAHIDERRRKLEIDRPGFVREFVIAGHHITLSTGEYPDGSLGEIFLSVDIAGSTMSGLLDGWAKAVSLGLQYGVPLKVYAAKFIGEHFEPCGFTGQPDIPHARSIYDAVMRVLVKHYGGRS
jgi:ribonucleoside-diphosphate reductase alpha chain